MSEQMRNEQQYGTSLTSGMMVDGSNLPITKFPGTSFLLVVQIETMIEQA